MIRNKPLIDSVILGRDKEDDPVKEFAYRNKASPIGVWCNFKLFTVESFNNIFNLSIDGVKLKFRHITLTVNGRHKAK